MNDSITKDYWLQLSEKAQWDCKVSMRGPDSHYGETLKWYTTSVLRGRVRDVFRVGGTVNTDLGLVIIPPFDLGSKSKQHWNSAHFIEHIQEAAGWLDVPMLYIEPTQWHKIMQLQKRKDAAKAVFTLAKEAPGTFPEHLIKELQRHYTEHLKGAL